jgi:ribosomal protein L17
MVKHLIHHILMFGWIENTSCQAGEHCHKFYIKLIKRLTNNKENWQRQVFRFHAKSQAVQNILAEIGKPTHMQHVALFPLCASDMCRYMM